MKSIQSSLQLLYTPILCIIIYILGKEDGVGNKNSSLALRPPLYKDKGHLNRQCQSDVTTHLPKGTSYHKCINKRPCILPEWEVGREKYVPEVPGEACDIHRG